MTQYCCPDCDRVVWHDCEPRIYRRRLPRTGQLPPLRSRELPHHEGTTLEEAWPRIFSDFAGGYQPPTPEEAREETGEFGRRKDGTGRRADL